VGYSNSGTGAPGRRNVFDPRLAHADASGSARSVSSSSLTASPSMSGSSAPVSGAGVSVPLDGHSAALLDNIRSLDHLPRLGSLQTLDLRGNDLRVS
jgi:protein phosphatase 1 regulatory subunit 37